MLATQNISHILSHSLKSYSEPPDQQSSFFFNFQYAPSKFFY